MNNREIDWGKLNIDFKSNKFRLMLAGILIIVFGLICCTVVPNNYKTHMVQKHQKDIKQFEATVENIAGTKHVNFHRYSPSTRYYEYTIRVYIDGILHTLEAHKSKGDNPGFGVDDTITVYNYKDRYALAEEELFSAKPFTQTVYAVTLIFGFALIIYGKYIYKEPEDDYYSYDGFDSYDGLDSYDDF